MWSALRFFIGTGRLCGGDEKAELEEKVEQLDRDLTELEAGIKALLVELERWWHETTSP